MYTASYTNKSWRTYQPGVDEPNLFLLAGDHKQTLTRTKKRLSTYNYKYNGKELQEELGLNVYDYGARNFDSALGRWMNIDILSETSRRFSPYAYAMDNPVFFIDVDGMYAEGNNNDRDDRPTYKGGHWSDSVRGVGENNNTSNGSADKSKAVEPPVSFFSTNEKSIFTGTFKENNKPKNYTLGDGKFKVFGHGGVDGKGDGWFLDAKLVFGGDGDIGTAKEFDDRMSQVNQAYAKLMTEHKDPKEINLYLCHSGEGNNSMAEKVSNRHPTSSVIGYDGFVMYNGTLSISGISTLEEKNDNKGYRVEFKNGKETSRILYTEYLKLKK